MRVERERETERERERMGRMKTTSPVTRRRQAVIGWVGVLGSCGTALACERAGTATRGVRSLKELFPRSRQENELVSEKYREAEQALLRGYGAVLNGDSTAAIEAFTQVLCAAPDRYKTAMPALLGRRDARRAIGDYAAAADDARREWLWGRGVRWPGWYIITYLSVRQWAVSDSGGGRRRGGSDAAQTRNQDKKNALVEPLLVIVAAAAYNILLFKYGLA